MRSRGSSGRDSNLKQRGGKLLGYPAAATLGKYCGSVIGGATSPALQVCRLNCDVLDCARKGQELPNFDMEVYTRYGKRIWVNVSLLVASHPQTQKRLVVHLIRNIGNRNPIACSHLALSGEPSKLWVNLLTNGRTFLVRCLLSLVQL